MNLRGFFFSMQSDSLICFSILRHARHQTLGGGRSNAVTSRPFLFFCCLILSPCAAAMAQSASRMYTWDGSGNPAPNVENWVKNFGTNTVTIDNSVPGELTMVETGTRRLDSRHHRRRQPRSRVVHGVQRWNGSHRPELSRVRIGPQRRRAGQRAVLRSGINRFQLRRAWPGRRGAAGRQHVSGSASALTAAQRFTSARWASTSAITLAQATDLDLREVRSGGTNAHDAHAGQFQHRHRRGRLARRDRQLRPRRDPGQQRRAEPDRPLPQPAATARSSGPTSAAPPAARSPGATARRGMATRSTTARTDLSNTTPSRSASPPPTRWAATDR